MRIFVLTLCALAATAAAQPIANMPPQRTRVVPAGTDPRLLAAITKANTDFEVAMKKADISTITEPYTEDAVFVTTDGTALKGRAQIEQLYRQRFAKSGPALETKILSDELMLDGDLAYERGRGLLARMDNGKRVNDRARFLTVWQRQTDGGWKILRNVVLPGP